MITSITKMTKMTKISNIIKTEYIFIICYVLFFTSLFIEDVALTNFDCSLYIKMLKALVMVLLVFLLIKQIYKKEYSLVNIFAVSFGFLLLFLTGDFFWLIITIMALASRNIEEKTIFKMSLISIIVLITVVFLLLLIGIVPDIYSYRTDFSNIGRHSFGFMHSASLPLCIFYLSTYCMMIKKDVKFKIITSLILCVLSIVLFKFCESRNALYLAILVTFFTILEPLLGNKKFVIKLLNFFAKSIGTICFAFSILPGLLRYFGIFSNFWYLFDSIFTNRSVLFSSAISTYGIHLFNSMSYSEFISQTVVVDSYSRIGVVLDSAYVYILIRYGIIALVFLWLIFWSLAKKNKGSYVGCIIIILVVLANTIDNDLLSYGSLPFMLIGIRALGDKSKNKET